MERQATEQTFLFMVICRYCTRVASVVASELVSESEKSGCYRSINLGNYKRLFFSLVNTSACATFTVLSVNYHVNYHDDWYHANSTDTSHGYAVL